MNNQPWTQWTGKKIILPMRACYRCNKFFEVSDASKKFCDYCSEYMMKADKVDNFRPVDVPNLVIRLRSPDCMN